MVILPMIPTLNKAKAGVLIQGSHGYSVIQQGPGSRKVLTQHMQSPGLEGSSVPVKQVRGRYTAEVEKINLGPCIW